ncbi:MAG: HD domain-containing protein [Chitinophagaceae bacterium]|nr:MAG: HD domain-containing protein [Chitinophagaceae bacterium]
MDIIQRVKLFAEKAHGSQRRKYSGELYIVHPVRVMELCREYDDSVPALAACLLHDVLEDTEVNEDDLNSFLLKVMNREEAQQTLALVIELTDIYIKKDFPDWNRRKRKAMETKRIEKTSALSQTIKYADIIDNCADMAEQTEDDFAETFLLECRALLKVLNKGDAKLYSRTVLAVENSLVQLRTAIREKKGRTKGPAGFS